jgi:hypothetical protein
MAPEKTSKEDSKEEDIEETAEGTKPTEEKKSVGEKIGTFL